RAGHGLRRGPPARAALPPAAAAVALGAARGAARGGRGDGRGVSPRPDRGGDRYLHRGARAERTPGDSPGGPRAPAGARLRDDPPDGDRRARAGKLIADAHGGRGPNAGAARTGILTQAADRGTERCASATTTG